MSTIIETYSDQDMLCPGGWENGFKDGVIESWGDAERAGSHRRTGDWTGTSFSFRRSDTDRKIRTDFASATRRYWPDPLEIKMTNDATRDALGVPYTVFVGQITGLRFPSDAPLSVDVELGDIVSHRLLSDQMQIPWRKIGDGFLDQLTTVSESLDRGTPEGRIYGIHKRVPDIDAPSHHGFCVLPTYLGIMDVSGNAYHVWLVCGHACKDVPTIRVDTVEKIADEGTQWFVPHHPGHTALFDGNPYNDFVSSSYGNMRRYTLVFGLVTDMFAEPDAMTDPDACASGNRELTVAVEGVEDAGDGSGELILDRFLAYEHWFTNDVVHAGPDSYQSGPWLTIPDITLFGRTVSAIDEDSFLACMAIGQERLPAVSGSPADPDDPPAGYVVSYHIGAKAGDRNSVKRWIAEWNRSCSCIFAVTHLGQIKIAMLHPTQAIKDAAPLLTDVTEILEGGFSTDPQFDQQALRVPFKGDYNQATGVYTLEDVYSNDTEIEKYGDNNITDAETQTYPAAPGITANYHLARMEGLQFAHPPRVVTLEQTIGPDPLGYSLGYVEIGDYVRFRCFDAVSNSVSEIRLGWVIAHAVRVGDRIVRVKVVDCEDLIDFDVAEPVSVGSPIAPGSPIPVPPPPPAGNSTAFEAIVIPSGSTSYELTLGTTGSPTDPDAPSFGTGPGIAYHAAWWVFTPTTTKDFTFSTVGSDYDTQIALFTADSGDPYGTMVEVAYDSAGSPGSPMDRSSLTFNLTGGTTYYILVAGYHAGDAGILDFSATAASSAVGDYYVATTGSDGGTGTIGDPFRTVGHAVDVLGGPGTVIVREGTYDENLVNNVPSGTSWANKVRIAAYPGETVWMAPSGSALGVVWLDGSQAYIEFDGINMSVNASSGTGGTIYFGGSTHHIRVQNAEMLADGSTQDSGIIAVGSSTDNEFINLNIHGTRGYGFYVKGHRNLIDRCDIHHTNGGGVHIYESGGNPTGNIVRNNRIHDISTYTFFGNADDPRRFGILIAGTANQIYNNVVYGITSTDPSYPVSITTFGGSDPKLWNNTIAFTQGIGIQIHNSQNAEVTNNIAHGNSVGPFSDSSSGTTTTNNSWQSPVNGADPQFVNPGTHDYRLQGTSPCIGQGATIGAVTTDINGVARPQGSAYDQGAYEYVAP